MTKNPRFQLRVSFYHRDGSLIKEISAHSNKHNVLSALFATMFKFIENVQNQL